MAACLPARAMSRAAIGNSHAPGDPDHVHRGFVHAVAEEGARAASTSASTMRGFQRLAMIAKRAPSGARRSPSMYGMAGRPGQRGRAV
jgi:hypothetical protein